MDIMINGKQQRVNHNLCVTELITQLNLQNRRLAVEINEILVPRRKFKEYFLKSADKVEIVQAIGGG